ncbi:MAG: carbamoyltransferase C-terminal domain-containing protein [Puia sp.]
MQILEILKCKKTLNLKIKFREGFRPFAPAVLAEDLSEYFERESASPYMLFIDFLRQKWEMFRS